MLGGKLVEEVGNIGKIKLYLNKKLRFSINVGDVIETRSSNDLLQLIAIANCDVKCRDYRLVVDSNDSNLNLEALYFEDAGREFIVVRVVEGAHYHYFAIYTGSWSYVAYYGANRVLPGLLEDVLDYVADANGDEYAGDTYIVNDPNNANDVLEQLKAVAEIVERVMPEFAIALKNKLSKIKVVVR
jgi:hypothetical protein